jgi:hypothetical protein
VPRIHAQPNAWTSHPRYQDDYAHDPCVQQPAPAFYDSLSARPPQTETLAEAPWFVSGGLVPFHCYQRRHRQEMVIGFIGQDARGVRGLPRAGEVPLLDRQRRFRFRSFVYVGDDDAMAARGVTLLVFHRDLAGEVARFPSLAAFAPSADSASDRPIVEAWIRRCRSRYGPPIHDDEEIVAFRVARGLLETH